MMESPSAYLIIDNNEINEKFDPVVHIERSIVLLFYGTLRSQCQFLNEFRPIFMCLKVSSDGGGYALSVLPWRLPVAVINKNRDQHAPRKVPSITHSFKQNRHATKGLSGFDLTNGTSWLVSCTFFITSMPFASISVVSTGTTKYHTSRARSPRFAFFLLVSPTAF